MVKKYRLVFFLVLCIVLIFVIGLNNQPMKMLEQQFLYFPEKEWIGTPDQVGLNFENVEIITRDQVKLHAWWVGPSLSAQTVLFFHGNAGNISHRLDRIARLRNLPLRFLMLDYRGFGRSSGTPDSKGLIEDALATYAWLRDQGVHAKDIVLFGESLGGAVAVELASQKPVSHLVLESTFTSVKDLASLHYSWMPQAMVPDIFPSLQTISQVQAPVYGVHGTQDEIVPIELGRKLFEAAPNGQQFYEVPSAGHNDVYLQGEETYQAKISEFLQGVESSPKA